MPGSLDASILSYVVQRPSALLQVRRAGIETTDFTEDYQAAWQFILRSKRQQGAVPSRRVVEHRFSDIELVRTREGDLPILLDEIHKRRKWRELLDVIDEASREAADPDDIEEAIQSLQTRVNELAFGSGLQSHMVDLFGKEAKREMLKDIRQRRMGKELGIPTGLKRLDERMGGLVRKRMVVVMGRSGRGKSWINLLFVANAVIEGHKVVLFPLEMTLQETAFRLYTIFSQKCFGANKAILNTDLLRGHVSKRKITTFLNALEDRFAGQLYIADVGSLRDPYTLARVESEVEIYKPAMFWVDYLTLLKSPDAFEQEDYSSVRALSNGIKSIAQRHDVVGGCSAQVNRESLRGNIFLPRLEHISFGDSIGHDADNVISINRKGEYLYYALIKNRHGPERGPTKAKWFVNEGIIQDSEDQIPEETDDD